LVVSASISADAVARKAHKDDDDEEEEEPSLIVGRVASSRLLSFFLFLGCTSSISS
jgi:hypothetical protein